MGNFFKYRIINHFKYLCITKIQLLFSINLNKDIIFFIKKYKNEKKLLKTNYFFCLSLSWQSILYISSPKFWIIGFFKNSKTLTFNLSPFLRAVLQISHL